jgi:predicted 3-demethylubiquinone-9 3-methyltransferase (glyoxalase superfamily)
VAILQDDILTRILALEANGNPLALPLSGIIAPSSHLKELLMPALDTYPRITPFLWFDSQAEQAANLYVSVFPNSRILEATRLPADNPSGPAGKVLVVGLELDGQKFTALNGGPGHPFTDAISLVIRCETQAEIDHYWAGLSADPNAGQCGWLKDPPRYIRHPAAMQAMLQMKKLDIATLEQAAGSSGPGR